MAIDRAFTSQNDQWYPVTTGMIHDPSALRQRPPPPLRSSAPGSWTSAEVTRTGPGRSCKTGLDYMEMGQNWSPMGPEIEMSVFSIYMYKPSNCCIRFWPISWPISMLKMLKQWKFKVDMSKMMLLVMWNLCWFGKLCSFCAEWKFYLQPLMEEEVAAGLLFAWFDPSHFGLVMPSNFRIIASCHFIFTLFLLLLYYFIMRKSS